MSKLKYLTDEMISLFSQDNVLTESRDFNLHNDNLTAYPNGIYDPNIFGSIFSNQCNCGRIKNITGLTCVRCGTTILDEVSSFKRFARIESPVYFCNSIHEKNLLKFLKGNFKFEFDLKTDLYEPKLTTRNLDILQFEDLGEARIRVTDEITEVSQCSYEGLLAIMNINYKELVPEFIQYINSNILVLPIVMRPPYYVFLNGNKELHNEQLSILYKNLIFATHDFYNQRYIDIKTETNKAIFRGILRKFLTKSTAGISRLLQSSRENFARTMQSTRIPNSGRCTIIPDPSLKVDEVYIPTHLIYECCREEFMQYIQDKLGVGEAKAQELYKFEAKSDQIQDLFREYIDGDPNEPNSGKYVFILRQPTLHELSILMMKVKLTNDYCMKIPMAVCNAFNADFDGDTMAFFAVPKKSNEEFLETMSPKNIIFYKKNHKPLFTPTHDIMQGLILATKVAIPDELREFDTIEEALQLRKKSRNFKWQTLFRLKGEETTLGREMLSKYFGKDINGYLGDFQHTLNSKNIIPLYSNLAEFEDRTDRIQKIQEFALNLTTISGATAPTLSQLYGDIDSEYLDQIKEIEGNESISEDSKRLKITELYGRYCEEQTEKFDDDVKLAITESSRAKISQLLNISLPQLNVGPDNKFHMANSRIIEGMKPIDYTRLAIENRAVQDVKQDSVPNGGYLTRQFAYVAFSFIYKNISDETNKGIKIPKREAIGRTKLDGSIVESNNSDEIIEVRSIIGSTAEPFVVTKDMIPNFLNFKDKSRIGVSMMTSLTEGLTQSSLALKHGGSLFSIEPNGELKLKVDCTLNIEGDFLKLITKDRTFILPKPSNFIESYTPNGIYKADDIIGATLKMNSPGYRLDSIIKLCGALIVTPKKKFARNKILKTDCYATNSGIISYKSDSAGNIQVFIGNEQYEYSDEAMYLFPAGAQVNKGDRICSGVLSLSLLARHTKDYYDIFYIFKKQFQELNSSIASELIEFLFKLIVTKDGGNLKLQSVINVIYNSKSIFTSVAFSNARKKFQEIKPEGADFLGDTLSQVMLSLIMDDKII